MAISPMYDGMNNSPQTGLSAAITSSDQVVPVTNISVFPAAPNLATLGAEEDAEVIRYNGIEGSTLTGCERGFGGTSAKAWEAGTVISRQITKYDLDILKTNINALDANKAETSEVYTKTEVDTALAAKADLDKEILYFYRQAVSAATSAQIMRIPASGTSEAITENTVVLECAFAVPSRITSDVSWTSYTGYIVFTGTCTAATTANVTLGQKGN